VVALALGCCGLVVGVLEVASNVEADSIELQIEKRIMSRCHGFWSLGAMSGALIGGPVFGDRGISVLNQFLVVSPIAVVTSIFISQQLCTRSAFQGVRTVDNQSRVKRVPLTYQVFLLCLIPIGVMAIEGAFMDWSAVFMKEQMKTNAGTAGYSFAMFAGVMAAVRLSGDWLGERFGDVLVVRVAIVYPLTMTTVARVNETNREDNVAYLSIAAFGVLMIAPPIIGGVAEISSLRLGLLCLVPGAVVTAIMANRLTTR